MCLWKWETEKESRENPFSPQKHQGLVPLICDNETSEESNL